MRYLVRMPDYYIKATRNRGNFKEHNEKEIKEIINQVSRISGYHQAKIMGKDRISDIVDWRMLVSYICRMNAYGTLNSVAKELGGLHHSSILNHIEKTQNLIDSNDKYFMAKFNRVKHLIK